MPGLLRGIARTAVVAGTATAVSNRVSRRQSERWAAEEPVQEAPAPATSGEDRIEQLKDLASLKQQGILTEEEFASQKARILAA
jgi:hypothetical protein